MSISVANSLQILLITCFFGKRKKTESVFKRFLMFLILIATFLQRVSIMLSAVLAIVNLSDRPSDRLSVTRWYQAKTTQATIMGCSLEDSPMTLVSSWLTSAQNSKGNLRSEGAE